MTIRYECPECDSVLTIRDDKAGKPGRCPKCKSDFVIPQPTAGIEATGDDDEDAFAFLMDGDESSSVSANTVLDTGEEDAPAEPVAPEDRELHRPAPREAVTAADTAATAGNLLSQTESARGKTTDEDVDDQERINMDEVRQTVVRRILPIAGIGLVLVIVCFVASTVLAPSSPTEGLPPLGGVTGTVTLDGKPLESAMVEFEPMTDFQKGEGTKIPASFGRTDKSGNFSLTVTGIDGAAVGKHRVRVTKNDDKGLEVLPVRYHRKTTLQKEVQAGSNSFKLELTSEPDRNERPTGNPNLENPAAPVP